MKRFRLFTKALAILLLLFGITTLVMTVFSAWLMRRSLTEQIEGKGRAIARGIAGASVEVVLFRDAATLQATLDQYLDDGRSQGMSYLFVVDERNDIISHTFHPGIPDEIRGLKGDRHEVKVQEVRFGGNDFIDISAPILASEVGHVHVGMDRERIRLAVRSALTQQAALMAALFLLSVVLAYFLVARLARPLRQLTAFARSAAAAEGAMSTEALAGVVPVGPPGAVDEVGQLAHAFQHMIQEVSSREQRLRRTQDELQSLNEHLEQRVAERSAAVEQRARDLAIANERLQREVAERQQAEEELSQERYLLSALMDTIPDSIYFKDVQSRFLRINRALAERLALKGPEEAVGKTDFDFFTEEHAAPAFADEQEVMRTNRPLVGKEEKETWADGRQQWVLTTKMPLHGRDGAIVGTFGISRDITRRKEAQIHLEESERRYRQLTEASLEAIVVADQQQHIQLFNPAAERTFGYRAEEVLGQPLAILVAADLKQAHERGFARFVATREAHLVGRTVELRGRRKDGTEFPLELSISALDLGGELQFLGAIRDLTERNRLRAMMVQTEKLASIGQLSAGVAHEINNPLAYVGNNLVVLERDVQGLMALLGIYEKARPALAQVDADSVRQAEEKAEEIDLAYIRENMDRLLSRTRHGVERVARIVHSMRGLARTETHELRTTQVPELIDMSLEMIRGQLRRRGIEVELAYDPGLPPIRCVPTQISQVLLNLLMNAQQAIESTERTDGVIRIGVRPVKDELVIEVADNGCGIDPAIRSRLFDPFFTTKPVGEGTGLGLSIVHSIITGHGGRIDLESQPGVGTVFRLFLPLQAKAEGT